MKMKRFTCLAFLTFLAYVLLTAWSMSVAGPNTYVMFTAYNPAAGTFVYCDSASPPSGVTCVSGAGADDGWRGVRGLGNKSVIIRPDTVSLTSGTIQFTVEGRIADRAGNFASMDLVAPIDFAAAAAGLSVLIVENVEQIRVGVRINGTDDGVPDSITVHFDGGQ